MKKIKGYIYTRVSTAMQVDGYSLDAQKDKIRKYADLHNIEIIGEYSDEGKSGKSIEGRLEFQRMIEDIKTKEEVDLVLVFKLSRFGRNCADTLNILEIMKSHDVDLVCVEDGIDSRNEMSKILIAIMSAIAEMERENIAVQTMAGRKEKAKQGGWNGGFAPTGYTLVDGRLEVNEAEAEVVKKIFDLYVNFDKSMSQIAKELKNLGYTREKRPNAKTDFYSVNIIKTILDSEIYMGKISYGKNKTEKKKGTNEYHRIKTDDYMVYDGKHEAIIDEELWNKAHKKRLMDRETKNYFRLSDNNHRYILSGLIKCPCCSRGLAGMNSRGKIKKDDTRYPDIHYYRCRHNKGLDGYECTNNRQLQCKKVDGAVEEIINSIVNQEKFVEMIKNKISIGIDTETIDTDIERLEKSIKKLEEKESALYKSISKIDIEDKYYDRKVAGINEQLDSVINDLENSNEALEEMLAKKQRLEEEKISADNIYTILSNFGRIYSKLTDNEKYELMHALIEEIEVFNEKRADKRIIKSVKFKVPVIYKGVEKTSVSVLSETTDETVVLMSKVK